MTDTKGAKDGSATFQAQLIPVLGQAQTDKEAIVRDPISLARATVRFTCASSGRRVGFFNLIEQGSKDKDFELKNRQLLCDMPVRWDSTYLMIERVLEMRPVSQAICPHLSTYVSNQLVQVFRIAATKQVFNGLDKFAMTDLEWKWLANFLDILAVSFVVIWILQSSYELFRAGPTCSTANYVGRETSSPQWCHRRIPQVDYDVEGA